MNRPAKLLVPCALAALAATACSGTTSNTKPPQDLPSADAVAKLLAAGLATGDVSAVPMTGPGAQADLKAIMAGMDGLRPTVTPGAITYDAAAKSANVALDQTMALGTGTWTWHTTAPLSWSDGAWKVRWSPSIVEADLGPTTRLRHSRDIPTRAPINGSDGQALVQQTKAWRVGIDKANLPQARWDATARQLAKVAGIDPAAYAKKVAGAGAKAFVPAITLRDGKVPPAATAIKGVASISVDLPLGPSTTFAPGILGSAGEATPEIVKASKGDVLAGDVVGLTGLQKRYDAQLRGTVGHTVAVVPRSAPPAGPTPGGSASGGPQPSGTTSPSTGDASAAAAPTKVVFTEPAKPGTPVAISLDRGLQDKAEKILASQKGIASLVVVKVGTGDVLAAANSGASGATPTATFGRLAPGSAFKVVSSLAMLRKGMTPTTKVPCTTTVTVGGRSFKNYSDFPSSKVGTITLTDALANSCNTAFISQASKLGPTDLATAAASLGMGADYDAGYSSFFGSVPTAPDEVTKAADMIGQGTVEASPMAMAGVAASVASGKTVVPWLVAAKKPTPTAKLTPAEASQLQTMMKAVVADGSGRVLSGLVDGAKTGTAEYGTATPPRTHAWMIAWNKTYAICAMVDDGESGSGTAGPIIKAFLGG